MSDPPTKAEIKDKFLDIYNLKVLLSGKEETDKLLEDLGFNTDADKLQILSKEAHKLGVSADEELDDEDTRKDLIEQLQDEIDTYTRLHGPSLFHAISDRDANQSIDRILYRIVSASLEKGKTNVGKD